MNTALSTSQDVDLERKVSSRVVPTITRRPTDQIITHPFVGRIGGNQVFTLSPQDPDYDEKVKYTPDAASSITWGEAFDLAGFVDGDLWQQAVIEGLATTLLVWITGLMGFVLVPTIKDFSSGALFPSLLGGLVNAISLGLFIFAAGPVSGGHLNPFITLSVFLGRLATFPRAILYILFQTLGATIAGFLIRAAIGRPDGRRTVIPGCSIDPALVSPGEALVLETTTCMALIFLAFGIGLDPRQKLVYGPALGPILIGITLGLCSFVTGAVKDGYTGASMNPARCFGLMAAEGRWDYHWVHWVGPLLAGIIHGLFYWQIPPSRRRRM